MKNNRQQFLWVIDAVLLLGFLFSFFMDVTGLALHQWLGLGVAVLAGYHLVTHWSWVKAVTARLFSKTSAQARAYWGLDAALMLGMGLIGGTGLLISTWFNLSLANYAFWKTLHVASSVLTLVVLWVKIALHGRWIVKVAAQFVSPLAQTPAPRLQPAPVTAVVMPERRKFLALMGVVSVASLLAASRAFDTQEAAQTPVTSAASEVLASLNSSAANPQSSTNNVSLPASSSSTTACQVLCNKRCSFPGQCRRYVDSNGNNLCDRGECL